MALHSICSLLSIPLTVLHTNAYSISKKKSATGDSIPTRLTRSKLALLKRHLRGSKYEPLVETVDILEVNTNYAHVRFNNGRETAVSLRHIASLGDGMNSLDTEPDPMPRAPKNWMSLSRLTLPPLQSTTENSAAKNSVPAISLPPLLDDSQGTLSEDTDSLSLRCYCRTR